MWGGGSQIQLQGKVTSDLGLEGWIRFMHKGVEGRKGGPGRGNKKETRRKAGRWARRTLLGAMEGRPDWSRGWGGGNEAGKVGVGQRKESLRLHSISPPELQQIHV